MDRLIPPKHDHYDYLAGADSQRAISTSSRLLAEAMKMVPHEENNKRLIPEARRTYEERFDQINNMSVPSFQGALEALPANIRAGTIDYNMAQAVIDLVPTFIDRANAKRQELQEKFTEEMNAYNILVQEAKRMEEANAK